MNKYSVTLFITKYFYDLVASKGTIGGDRKLCTTLQNGNDWAIFLSKRNLEQYMYTHMVICDML